MLNGETKPRAPQKPIRRLDRTRLRASVAVQVLTLFLPVRNAYSWNKATQRGENEVIRPAVLACVIALCPTAAFALDNSIDPNKVAPQYRDVAEKRQAELIRQKACQAKAEKEKIVKRDLSAYVVQCMDAAEKAERVEIELKKK